MENQRRMSRFLCLSGGTVLAVAMVTGCSWTPEQDTDPNFTVRQEDDIPVPESFIFDKDRSSSYIRYADRKMFGSFRSGWAMYYGDQQVGVLVHWYAEQMKKDGWAQKSVTDNLGKKCLTFAKVDDTAEILLNRDFDPRFDKYLTYITARIRPTRTEELTTDEILNPSKGVSSVEVPGTIEPAGGAEMEPSPAIIQGTKPVDGEVDLAPTTDQSEREIQEPIEKTTDAPSDTDDDMQADDGEKEATE